MESTDDTPLNPLREEYVQNLEHATAANAQARVAILEALATITKFATTEGLLDHELLAQAPTATLRAALAALDDAGSRRTVGVRCAGCHQAIELTAEHCDDCGFPDGAVMVTRGWAWFPDTEAPF